MVFWCYQVSLAELIGAKKSLFTWRSHHKNIFSCPDGLMTSNQIVYIKNKVAWWVSPISRKGKGKGKEGNVLFNDALNTLYLRLYGIRHMVKDHSDSEKGNPLPPHKLLFPINSNGSFICTIPQIG